jgi:hypothetical protein
MQANIYQAITNLGVTPCRIGSDRPFVCSDDSDSWSGTLSNNGLYPRGFYWVLGFLLVESPTASIAIIRFAVAFSVAALLMTTMCFLPGRHRLVLFLVILTGFSNTGFFLFSSLNPSSWAAIGSCIGFLTLHAAACETSLSLWRRGLLFVVSFLAYLMSLASRIDSVVVTVVSLSLIAGSLIVGRKTSESGISLFFMALVSFVALGVFRTWRTILNILSTFQARPGESTRILWSTLDSLPLTLGALGTIPADSDIPIPAASEVIALAVLAWFVIRTFSGSKLQVLGTFALLLLITLGLVFQPALANNERTGNEGRYFYPVLLVLLAWWYLNGPVSLGERTLSALKPAIVVVTALFSVLTYVVAERYVDYQSQSIRFLPEGADAWWWAWMPIGPNILLLMAPIFLWLSLSEIRQTIVTTESEHNLR